MNFYIDDSGQFSGGGSAVLNNLRFAAKRHRILRGSPEQGATPFIMRNVPARGRSIPHTYVLGPQNALPFTPYARGREEWELLIKLRLATEFHARRSVGLFRTSSTIPQYKLPPLSSPVLHNPLDTGFEDALTASQGVTDSPGFGRIVSIGTGRSYRNLTGLLRGYAQYRTDGGALALFISGSPGNASIRAEVERQASMLPDVRIHWGGMPRPQFMAALRSAAAVVLPSLVEASPLSALEACALTDRVVLSDIVGHREILRPYSCDPGTDHAFFDPRSPAALARALHQAEQGGAALGWHNTLSRPDQRAKARELWSAHLANWLETLSTKLSGR